MTEAGKILIVEDNPGDVRLIVEMLADAHVDMVAESVGTLATAIGRLDGADIDVVLLDLGLPDSQGIETFSRIREAAAGIAVIVLTGNSDIALAAQAVQEGAQDFLVKGRVDGELLTRAIAYALSRMQADEAMRREKGFLANAERLADLGSWRYDLATKQAWWSDEMHHIFGFDPDTPPEDLVAAAEDAVYPEDRERQRTPLGAVLEGRALEPTQFRITLPDGSLRWIRGRSQEERDAHGAIIAVAGVTQDITELKLSEDRLVRGAALDRDIALLSAVMVTSNPSIAQLAELVLADAKQITHSPLGFISPRDPAAGGAGACESEGLDALAGHDDSRVSGANAESAHIHPGGWSTRSGEPFYTNSVATDVTIATMPAGHLEITSFMSVPATAEGRFVGQVAVANAPGGYTDEDLEDVKRLAALYAIALVGQEERAALVASESNLRKSNLRFEKMIYGVSEAMGRIVEARDPYTQGHEVRVAQLAKLIALEMALPGNEVDAIEMCGLVHDIGKLSVPAEILTRPGHLSDLEFALIKGHPEAGYTILKGIDFPWPVADIVVAHHERQDGSGYPEGLMGDDIPMAARVLAVADVVEAMASHRPYRPALGLDVALAELREHPEKYDQDVVVALCAVYDSGRADFLGAA